MNSIQIVRVSSEISARILYLIQYNLTKKNQNGVDIAVIIEIHTHTLSQKPNGSYLIISAIQSILNYFE